jgi:ubiquinone/menaquinone biosynthesis C-methylase UbiE
MISRLRGKLHRIRTRLVMRSALSNGMLFRWMRRDIGDRFNQRAADWDRMVADHEHKWFAPLDAALDRLPLAWKPEHIVDIGGGTGRAGYHLAGRYPEAMVVVVDIAPRMLATGKKRRQSERLPVVDFVTGDSVALPLKDGSADLACVLNAPPNIAEIHRVLRPGGVVVLAFTYGHHTPMYLDEATCRRALARGGFPEIQSGQGGEGTYVLGRMSSLDADREPVIRDLDIRR